MFANKALCILGPTSSGKSNLTIKISQLVSSEIISVDSTMVYNYMNIGTDKPDIKILKKIKHNLVNIIDPKENYSVIKFCNDSFLLLKKSWENNKLPIFVGGNLMYMWIFQNIFLKKITNNVLLKNKDFKINFINIGLMPKDKLNIKHDIERRLKKMIKIGFINEVYHLYTRGDLNINLNSINSIGYKDFWLYIDNKINFNSAKESIINSTLELSNKQILWLKNWQTNILYFDSKKNILFKIYDLINNYFFHKRGHVNVLEK